MEELRQYGGIPIAQRVVENVSQNQGKLQYFISGGGVTSSIDVGLFLCEKLKGRQVRETIQQTMDYPFYQHPFLSSDSLSTF